MAGTNKKTSSRAQKEDYTPVSEGTKKDSGKSTFVPNGELPEDASYMDRARAAAKKADEEAVKEKSALLKALEEKEQSGS